MSSRIPERGARVGGKIPPVPRTGVQRRVFPLPPSQVSAAENWVTFGSRTPRKARRASSVCLVRDDNDGLQTYLSYRAGESPLGTVAFPGGSVEADDFSELQWFGPSLGAWSAKMGVLDQRLVRSHVVCAIRELFEETGILLAGADEQTVAEAGEPEEWMAAREAIAGQDLQFSSFLARRGLGVRTDLLRPVAHWVSPNFALRRFDTWYFSAAVPQGQSASLLRAKGRWAQWCNAREVIAQRHGSWLGDLVDQPDTRELPFSQITYPAVEMIMEQLAESNGAIAYLARLRSLQAQHPNLLEREERYLLEVVTSDDGDLDDWR